MTNPYDTLGLEPGASIDEIRAAYRQLARNSHPDRFTDASAEEQQAANERMQEINRAFAVLTDPSARQRFERQQRLRRRRSATDGRQADQPGNGADDARGAATGHVHFRTRPQDSGSTSPDGETDASNRGWRTEPRPDGLEVTELSGWGGEHWVYVNAPGGRAAKMNVTTGEVTIEREELREDVMRLLQHYAADSWSP